MFHIVVIHYVQKIDPELVALNLLKEYDENDEKYPNVSIRGWKKIPDEDVIEIFV